MPPAVSSSSSSSSSSPAAAFPFNAPQPAPDPPRRACVPLAHKRVPTEMRAPADHAGLVYAALLARDVDITALRDLVLALPEEQWQERYNRAHNVYFQRPFHDKLGVNNIMCLFSDTQLENVYELPLYATYRAHLEPLFARIGVDAAQVVRCLFARMPGETLIPPHHDNGPWVAKTHRVHVPLVTFADVEFKSGALAASMTRFAFNERTIVELNNAAKHSVWNPGKQFRVHLIFDYVEDETQRARATRHVLSPGQVCRQVRGRVELFPGGDVGDKDKKRRADAQRQAAKLHGEVEATLRARVGADAATTFATACRHYFIEQISARDFVQTVSRVLRGRGGDLEEDPVDALWPKLVEMFGLVDKYAKRELLEARRRDVFAPNWVIIGAQKCGTTSLFEYLSQHPQLLKGRRREPHFFDWNWDAALQLALPEREDAQYKDILREFAEARRRARHPEDPVEGEEDSAAALDGLRGNSLDDMRAKYLASLQCEDVERALRAPRQIGESTPSYLLYGERVARRVRWLYPHMKLIVMLRDPVKRAFSHYQMTADPHGTPAQLAMRAPVRGKTFEQVVDEDLALLAQADVAPARGDALLDGVAPHAADCFQRYADALSQRHGAHSFVGRGLYALQLTLWLRVFPREQLLIVDLDGMKTPEGTRRVANEAFEFLGVAPHDVADTERKNSRAYGAIDPATAQRLREFYRPFNEQLFELVGRRFEW